MNALDHRLPRHHCKLYVIWSSQWSRCDNGSRHVGGEVSHFEDDTCFSINWVCFGSFLLARLFFLWYTKTPRQSVFKVSVYTVSYCAALRSSKPVWSSLNGTLQDLQLKVGCWSICRKIWHAGSPCEIQESTCQIPRTFQRKTSRCNLLLELQESAYIINCTVILLSP